MSRTPDKRLATHVILVTGGGVTNIRNADTKTKQKNNVRNTVERLANNEYNNDIMIYVK